MMSTAPGPPYISYAPIYDATGQSEASEHLARAVLARLVSDGGDPSDALDLGCGTGTAALVLAASGLRVTAVDQAPAMLAIAAGRMRDLVLDVAFVEADVRMLRQPAGSFDLVTCFGLVNELAGDRDLARLVALAARWLKPGGYLAFDLLTPAFFAARQDADAVLHDGADHLVLAQILADDQGQAWARRIVWFVREIDRWWRGEETHPLRAWSEAQVGVALRRAGFVSVARLPDSASERVLLIARRERRMSTEREADGTEG